MKLVADCENETGRRSSRMTLMCSLSLIVAAVSARMTAHCYNSLYCTSNILIYYGFVDELINQTTTHETKRNMNFQIDQE